MKMKIQLIIFLSLSFCYSYAASSNTLVIEFLSGKDIEFVLNDAITAHFNEGNILLEANNIAEEIPIRDINKFYYKYSTDVANETISVNQYKIETNRNTIQVSGIQKKSHVQLFSISGKYQTSNIKRVENSIYIDIELLPTGIYILAIDEYSFKIYIK